jgi:hypothetical protein
LSKTLGLAIPELVKPDKEHFDLRQKPVDEWLDNLPRANIGETARRVFETLVEINRFKYPHQNRMYFLEHARETVLYVTDAMKRHFVGINSPLPAKNQKIVAATREIHHAMAIGYMIAIESYLGSNLFFSDNKLLATMLQRAISSLGKVLLTSYQTYTPYPANIWSSIHKLYMAAENHKLLNMTIVDEQNIHHVKTSINSEYIRILLLALTSPYRLRHGEAGKIYSVVERWIAKSKLTTLDTVSKSKTLFAVNLASDEPPRNYSLLDNNCDSEFCRILDSTALTKAIRKDLKHGFKTGETTITSIEMNRPDLSQDLMKRLLIAWCILPKRSYPRTQTEEPVQVTLGLTATHQIIINGNQTTSDVDDVFEHTAHYEANSVSNSIADKQPDVWEMIYFPTETEGMELLEEQLHKDQGSENKQKKTQPMETWLILNESARGYCIRSINDPKNRAQVGELIGVRRQSSHSMWKWGVGVIRWLRAEESNGLMMGIELLTPDAAAIGLRAVSNAKHDYHRTLMLPELKAVNQPTTLITTAVPYRVGHKLVINILGKEILVRLTKQVQNTGLFAQFQFEIMEEQNAVVQGEQEDENAPDFSGVWTSI